MEKMVKSFYRDLFTKNGEWAKTIPNIDETKRLGVILDYLCLFANMKGKDRIRILDYGCGRGWLTNISAIYGEAEGYDPVESVILKARNDYPDIKFFTGDLDVIKFSKETLPYDVVICTEVIEHVWNKEELILNLIKLLKKNGGLILTTPRRKWYNKWSKWSKNHQPVEEWVSECEFIAIVKKLRLDILLYRRIYKEYPKLSFLHSIAASEHFKKIIYKQGLDYLNIWAEHYLSVYQAWLLQRVNE